MNIDLHKIGPNLWGGILALIITISTGALAVFVFDKDLFLTLDIFKLSLLSVSIVIPIYIINSFCFFSFLFYEEYEGRNPDNTFSWFMITLSSIAPIYLTILISLFWEFSSKSGIIITAIIQTVILFSIFIIRKIIHKNKAILFFIYT